MQHSVTFAFMMDEVLIFSTPPLCVAPYEFGLVSGLFKIILGQRSTSSKVLGIQSRTPPDSSFKHRQGSGFVLAKFLKINSL